jgi:hypothetical protein
MKMKKYTIENFYETFDFNSFETIEEIMEDDNTIILMV